ncbi:unnamed protein product [Cercospora beticola]|nr:unnamed protein product [Cercospora beticola]
MANRTVPIMAPAAGATPSVFAENFATNVNAGTDGTSVKARVNYFDVKLPKVEKLYLYSVNITRSDTGGEVKLAGFKKDLIRHLITLPPLSNMRSEFATDYHSNVVFLTPQGRTLTKTVVFAPAAGSQQQTFNVTLSCTHTLAMSDLNEFLHGRRKFDMLPYMTALNILSRSLAAASTVKVGRDKFFPAALSSATWSRSLNFRNGFFTSMRPVNGRVILNIHGVACAFVVEQPVHLYASAFNTKFRPNLAARDLRNLDQYFKSLVKGLRVRLLYTPPTATNAARSKSLTSPVNNSKIKRINGFGRIAKEQTFRHNVHGVITVEKYFNEHVLEPSSHLRFPLLLTCDLGTRDKPCFVPAELLYIAPHQPFFGKLPESAMKDMIKVSQRLPLPNVDMIEDCLKVNKMFDSQAIQKSQKNGVSIELNMRETNARVISIPGLAYGGNVQQQGCSKEGTLRNGRWDLRNKTFRTSGRLGALGVIQIGGASAPFNDYISLTKALTKNGLRNVQKVKVAESPSVSQEDLSAALAEIEKFKEFSNEDLPQRDRPARCLLIVLPNKTAAAYESVKWWADAVAGVHTVCIAPANTTQLGKPQFQANLALKFNVKAGGNNHTLLDGELEHMHPGGVTMYVGADVTHPGPGSIAHCPSVAAVVASDGRSPVNYPGSLRLQRCRQESIEDMESMMMDRLETWHAKNNSVPTNVLFYRDGVSESQFAMVKNTELPKVMKACENFALKHVRFKDWKPRVTLVVCGKRHHTRFYPPAQVNSSVKWAIDRNSNFLPGLVVDSPSIRNAYHFDFFLQSHAALKGTARPCHYFAIHNGMNLTADKLQRITNNLCWIFARALTPISYASPAYYADRLAERGRCYLAPFLSPIHPARPSEDQLFQSLANARTATIEQKDLHVLAKIKGGSGDPNHPHWVTDGPNPFKKEIGGTMYYI